MRWSCDECGFTIDVPADLVGQPVRHRCEKKTGGPIDLSVIITTFNEGAELARTIADVRKNTSNVEIVVVDDGSTDHHADHCDADVLIRHNERIGIAYSRNEGTDASHGKCIAYLDAHHRLDEGVLNRCAEVALERRAIVYPDVRGIEDRYNSKGEIKWTGHGASMQLVDQKRKGLFGAKWNTRAPRDPLSRVQSMIVPGYVMSRETFGIVRWIDGLKGWGASEPAIAVKAFFADVDILHLCGLLCRHEFRAGGKIPYRAGWKAVSRNHAIVARVCFSVDSWEKFWRKTMGRYVDKQTAVELETSDRLLTQQREFEKIKRRPDSEFWRGFLGEPVPEVL